LKVKANVASPIARRRFLIALNVATRRAEAFGYIHGKRCLFLINAVLNTCTLQAESVVVNASCSKLRT
jgi:hypothetical protein